MNENLKDNTNNKIADWLFWAAVGMLQMIITYVGMVQINLAYDIHLDNIDFILLQLSVLAIYWLIKNPKAYQEHQEEYSPIIDQNDKIWWGVSKKEITINLEVFMYLEGKVQKYTIPLSIVPVRGESPRHTAEEHLKDILMSFAQVENERINSEVEHVDVG
jgi:hypothetical protein